MSNTQAPKMSETILSKNVQIQRTDLSTFDDSFSFLKEKFAAEMRRVDEEMTNFSTNLMSLYEQSRSDQVAQASPKDDTAKWETIISSPLVQGEGGSKTLKLQFDVSHFDPTEVRVQILKDILTVSARHELKSNNTNVFREFTRHFHLPKGTNPDAVISSVSRDGVLTVQAPLPSLDRAIKNLSGNQQQSQLQLGAQSLSSPQAKSPPKTGSKTQK